MDSGKRFVLVSGLFLIFLTRSGDAAQLPDSTRLTIAPGVSDGSSCISGSCSGFETSPGVISWVALQAGSDGGLVVGKTQKPGTGISGTVNSTGELTNSADLWLTQPGTFFTDLILIEPGAGSGEDNLFDDTSCNNTDCAGKTELKAWHMEWGSGVVVPFGSQSWPCPDCAGVSSWVVNTDSTYSLDFSWTSPPGHASSLGGIKLVLHLEGSILIAPPQFSEVSGSSGIPFQSEGASYGIGWIDFDNDGLQDLYVASGPGGGTSRLFRNLSGGQFSDITDTTPALASTGNGVAVGDYDGDGFDDIFVANRTSVNFGQNRLLRNRGDGTFEDVTAAALLSTELKDSMSAAFGDVNEDGYLDLYVANFSGGSINSCAGNGIESKNDLYLNNGDGTFARVDVHATDTGCTWATVMTDYDQDGDLDILVVNDVFFNTVPTIPASELFHNDYIETGTLAFRPVSTEIGLDARIAGMGIAVGDYNNDFGLDYYQTDLVSGTLSTNSGNNVFTTGKFLSAVDQQNVGWGAGFFDANNDGFVDLYRGNSDKFFGRSGASPNSFFINNQDGSFSEVATFSGLSSTNAGTGLAYADYDNDGDMDVAVRGTFGDVNLFRNELIGGGQPPNAGNFVKVRLVGLNPNHRGIGAVVFLYTTNGTDTLQQMREIHAGSSLGSTHAFPVHFGVGDHNQVTNLVVRWPSGCVQQISNPVGTGSEIIVSEAGCDTDGDGIPDLWETANGLDSNNPADAILDGDADGLNNLGEYTNGTDPNNSDTDNDLSFDGYEVSWNSDPANATSFPFPPVLMFDAGTIGCAGGLGTPPDNCNNGTTVTGSYFAPDQNGDGSFQLSEREALAAGPDGGILIGTVQPAGGSHSGCPDGTENPGMDAAWCFFANTGVLLTTTAITIVNPDVNSDAGLTKTLDFSGWAVEWNSNPVDSLGGDPGSFPQDTGLATLTCSQANCPVGSSFTLDYTAHGDPNGSAFFGSGAFHSWHFEGKIANTASITADGDLNLDGIVNAADVLLASRIALGGLIPTATQLSHGDVAPLVGGIPMPDGKLNAGDLLVIQRKALGQVSF